jgi:RNA polymerase sigma-70 factor, ECF subfamily
MNRHEAAQPSPQPASDDEDVRLVALAQGGDRIAFDRLVVKYRDRIVSLCVRTLGDFSGGEDAAQETFFKAYTNVHRFTGDAAFSTWLYRIAVNTCTNQGTSWWSRTWRAALHLDKEIKDEEGGARPRELGDTSMLPSKELERKTAAAALKTAIQKLPLIHRQLVILRDMEGKSYEEIRVITGISEGTVKSRLARARAALRKDLQGADE